MKPHALPFLGLPAKYRDLDRARVAVVPFPYEAGVSYGLGAAGAPQAVLAASQHLELYDEILDAEPFRVGIATIDTPKVPEDPLEMLGLMTRLTDELSAMGKFVVVVGGDHSISSGFVRALSRHYPAFGVIQLDAHADLRERYEGRAHSHACSMARIREITPYTLQIGIRSMSAEEARRVKKERLPLCPMHEWRGGRFDLGAALAALPERVSITLDVDVFDWSVVSGTGTPEPGGMGWDEALDLLKAVFEAKEVIGCDVVELASRPGDINSPFAVAKLIYKIIGFRFARELQRAESDLEAVGKKTAPRRAVRHAHGPEQGRGTRGSKDKAGAKGKAERQGKER